MRKPVFWRGCLLPIMAVLALPVYAADIPNLSRKKIIVPDNIAGVETLLAADVIEKARTISNLIVIDSRIESDRLNGYIESSISLPDTKPIVRHWLHCQQQGHDHCFSTVMESNVVEASSPSRLQNPAVTPTCSGSGAVSKNGWKTVIPISNTCSTGNPLAQLK